MSRNKYINTFDSTSEYEDFITSQDAGFPNVAFVLDDYSVHYDGTMPVSIKYVDGTYENGTPQFMFNGSEFPPVLHKDGEFYIGSLGTVTQPITSLRDFTARNKENIKTITINFDTSSVTSMQYMFLRCTSMTSVDVSSIDISSCASLYGMFQECTSLTSLDLSTFRFGEVYFVTYDRMFYGCTNLQSLDLRGWAFGGVSKTQMFYGCTSLTDVYIDNYSVLSMLTNNLSAADNAFIPSTATIHYDDGQDVIDYVWNNGAWVDSSISPEPVDYMYIDGPTFRSLNGITANGQLANGDYILYTDQPDDPTFPANVTLTVDYNSGNRFYSTNASTGGAFRLYNNTDGYIEIVTNGMYGNITKIEFICVANYLGGDMQCDSGSFTSDSAANTVTWTCDEMNPAYSLQIYNGATPQLRFDAFKIYFEAYSE